MELLGLAGALLGAGLLAGFLGGLVGAGGGLIVVPVLYHTFSALAVDPAVRMHLVVGTALGAVVPMSLMGARAHWRRGNVSTTILGRLALPVLLGALGAAAMAGHIDGRALAMVFALVAAAVALNMALNNGITLRDGLPGPVGTGLAGVAIGSLSTLVGIGGATLAVPILHAFRTPMRIAVGTASVLGGLIALPGAIAFIAAGQDDARVPPGSVGYVNVLAVAIIFPASALAITWGAALTQRVDERLLRAAFALLLALTAARMLSH